MLLNLGCGAEPRSGFVNIDIVAGPNVVVHDLRRGIPYPDSSCELVYHATMLSHLRPADAIALTRECCRVLRPGGVLRVVTEDLEQMCRTYLQKLDAACSGGDRDAREYEWMMLELYDQATREESGGGMARFVSQHAADNEAFIVSRVGEQGRRMVAAARSRAARTAQAAAPRRRLSLSGVTSRARRALQLTVLGRNGLRALDLGEFRLSSGQVSYRMYDRYSLKRLLLDAGFSQVSVTRADESAYPSWADINPDITPDGLPARPHALIMEGIRP